MSRTDLRLLLDRGRKAGLKTAELYQALNARSPQPGDSHNGLPDPNGFVFQIEADGQHIHFTQPPGRTQ